MRNLREILNKRRRPKLGERKRRTLFRRSVPLEGRLRKNDLPTETWTGDIKLIEVLKQVGFMELLNDEKMLQIDENIKIEVRGREKWNKKDNKRIINAEINIRSKQKLIDRCKVEITIKIAKEKDIIEYNRDLPTVRVIEELLEINANLKHNNDYRETRKREKSRIKFYYLSRLLEELKRYGITKEEIERIRTITKTNTQEAEIIINKHTYEDLEKHDYVKDFDIIVYKNKDPIGVYMVILRVEKKE